MLKIVTPTQLTRPSDKVAISSLCAKTFGPGRFARTAFRLREAYSGTHDFGLCVWSDCELIGSIAFTPIKLGGKGGAFLLGPLVVRQDYSGRGYGVRLIEDGIESAYHRGAKMIVLIGDLPYYGRFGFFQAGSDQFNFPGPVDRNRILVKELQAGALEQLHGKVHV